MKPPPFDYHAPASLDEALETLADVGEDGKVLAGGQSLIPLLNMRLAAPSHLVDINRVDELRTTAVTAEAVRVGAAVRQADLEHHRAALAACPLLGHALRLVAHPVIRNRGTVCGSIAHADPAAELAAVLAVLGGTVHLASAREQRDVSADAFFLGPLEADVRPDELVTAVTFPAMGARSRGAFVELARRHGDYALCGVAVVVRDDAEGTPEAARAALISVGPTPVVVDVEDSSDPELAAEQVAAAVEPDDDIHATAAYRRHLARVLTARALREAA